MPIYEYKCLSCGYRFERFQAISEEPVKECPQCNGEVKKLISSTSFVLKGSGWSSSGSASKSACASCSSNSCASCKK